MCKANTPDKFSACYKKLYFDLEGQLASKKPAREDDQLLVEHHQSSAYSILQASRKKIPVEDVLTKCQMTIQVGIEKTSELSICCSNDADLEMAIADFFLFSLQKCSKLHC